ncbi:hypothetical protein GR131_28005 [Streptomyces sp. GF20]|uniref:hypothetical protein n=1 Tax=Streptomyces sp. GF20 TaxID=2692235 RepID=UPI0013197DAF|nr:hypothetical protein [Streptomyces sp. GF20]QHC18964.1 hypothetical protein GR131_28005 [Streptomyces sp. GF20]
MHVALLFIVPVAALTVALAVRSRRKRTAALAAQWGAFQQHRSYGQGQVLQVTRVYQHGRRGSKAVVTWCDNGRQQDAWFWNWHVPAGAYLLVNASSGYGTHSHNPNVLYVQPGQVRAWVPGQAARAAQCLSR